MELQLKKRLMLIIVLAIAFASCEEELESPYEEDSANQRFSLSAEWNDRHPFREIIVPADDYSVLCMADSHVGGTINLDYFLNVAKTKNVSAVIMAGDITTGNEKDYNEFQKHLPVKDSLLSFLTVGNHDLWSHGWKDYYSRFGASNYLFMIKTPKASDLYVCLDSGSGTLGNKQLDWLCNILKNQRQDYRRCFVFTHTNFFRVKHGFCSNPAVEELNVLIGLFSKYNVDIVLSGHEHKREVYLFGITTYITIGSLSDEYAEADYLGIRVENGKIEHKFEDLNLN